MKFRLSAAASVAAIRYGTSGRSGPAGAPGSSKSPSRSRVTSGPIRRDLGVVRPARLARLCRKAPPEPTLNEGERLPEPV
ncbi:hypothetical protein [Streptomyces humi]|uniref:hypothetical protein n=1 Tax=Streptomyces humi TaxID=1428620 RepID=UPI0006288ED2|nr:hypothetical protein [Streptomyces humi]